MNRALVLIPARLRAAALSALLVVSACAGTSDAVPVVTADPTPRQHRSIFEVVGAELSTNRVVPLLCIPSRSDPVGVWLGLRVTTAEVVEQTFVLGLQQTDARLGSHPSGCSDPEIRIEQSVFLLQGEDNSVLASSATRVDGKTMLIFELGDRAASDFDLMLLPTLAFNAADGAPHTTIYGLIERFKIVSDEPETEQLVRDD